MKVIAINGITKSGKTTVCEVIISKLTELGYSVGSVKEIHFEEFKIDPLETTNTNRHKNAGSKLVTARGMYETDILYQSMLSMPEILRHYDHDFVILEGVTDVNAPRIITAHTEEEVEERMDARVVAVSGVLANDGRSEFEGLPVVNALTQPEKLVQLVLKHAYEPLPDVDEKCCTACGHTCRELAGMVASGKLPREMCVQVGSNISLKINGKDIDMVPFVRKMLENTLMGVVGELNGFSDGCDVEVSFRGRRNGG